LPSSTRRPEVLSSDVKIRVGTREAKVKVQLCLLNTKSY
jgi:hypothetical protein